MNKLVLRTESGVLNLPLAVIATVALQGLVASAQAGVPQVATINFSAAIMQTNESKRDFGVLQAKFAPRQAQLETLGREVDALRSQLNQTNGDLNDVEHNARTQTLNAKTKQLQRAEEDYKNDSQSEGQETFQRIAQKVNDFLQKYAKQHGYAMVLDRGSSDTTPIVLYAIDRIDITGELISAYDTQSGIQAPEPKKGTGKDHP